MVAAIEIFEQEQVSCPVNIYWVSTPCKKMADLHPRQGNLPKKNVLSSLPNLKSLNKIGWRSPEQFQPFFKHASYSVHSS
jgi:hypothetical protein